jgi:hypothetical protein
MAVSNAADQAIDNNVITIDRRNGDRRQKGKSDAAASGGTNPPRRKKQRRRHIDPTTCERDYNSEEIEFMRAMDDYKHDSGRMFPTCSEVLEVIRGLGYVKLTDAQAAQIHDNGTSGDEQAGQEAGSSESVRG